MVIENCSSTFLFQQGWHILSSLTIFSTPGAITTQQAAHLTLSNMTIYNTTSGILSSANSTVEISNSNISSRIAMLGNSFLKMNSVDMMNMKDNSILCYSNSKMELVKLRIHNCVVDSVTGYLGAFVAQNCYGSCHECEFVNNSASSDGCFIGTGYTSFHFSKSKFESNSGGTIYVSNSNFTLTDSIINNNTQANAANAVIRITNSPYSSISSSVFNNNTGARTIYITAKTNLLFDNNTVAGSQPGNSNFTFVFQSNESSGKITNSSFHDNKHGVIVMQNSNFILSNSSITNNTFTNLAALRLTCGTLDMDNVTFRYNTASADGGIISSINQSCSTSLNIRNSVLLSNTIIGVGATIVINGSIPNPIILDNVQCTSNRVSFTEGSAGCLYLMDAAAQISNSSIFNNQGYHGGLYAKNANLSISNGTTINSNRGVSGGLYISSGVSRILFTILIFN